jgi:hypothetical protein
VVNAAIQGKHGEASLKGGDCKWTRGPKGRWADRLDEAKAAFRAKWDARG